LADVLISASAIESVTGSPRLQSRAEEMLALSIERGLPLNLGWATAYRGAALSASGQGEEGLALIMQGMARIRATGAVTGGPDLLMMHAAALGRLGRHRDALNCLAEASGIIATTDERHGEAELHRLRGDALSVLGDEAAAEQSYQQALLVARLQSARLFELRASVSLAALWFTQHKRDQARGLLVPIHGWFNEGLAAPDMMAAKGLLERLQ
jgi:predicted ATPase